MTTYSLYDDEVKLDFSDRKHVYTVDGTKVPSVTGITGLIDKSGPLMWWAVGQCLEYVEDRLGGYRAKSRADKIWRDEVEKKQFLHDAHRAYLRSSKKAADIGTLAHEWIADYLEGKDPAMPANKTLAATVESFLEWAESIDLQPVETEFKILSMEHSYAGTCDFDGFIDGERVICDWKTSKRIYDDEHGMQTWAYMNAREEELSVEYDARYAVAIPRDGGEIKVKRWGREDDPKHETMFMGCLAVTQGKML